MFRRARSVTHQYALAPVLDNFQHVNTLWYFYDTCNWIRIYLLWGSLPDAHMPTWYSLEVVRLRNMAYFHTSVRNGIFIGSPNALHYTCSTHAGCPRKSEDISLFPTSWIFGEKCIQGWQVSISLIKSIIKRFFYLSKPNQEQIMMQQAMQCYNTRFRIIIYIFRAPQLQRNSDEYEGQG